MTFTFGFFLVNGAEKNFYFSSRHSKQTLGLFRNHVNELTRKKEIFCSVLCFEGMLFRLGSQLLC